MTTSSTIGTNIDLLIIRNDQILLGRWNEKYSNGKESWGVPGKDLRFGETFGQAAERNVREEFDLPLIRHEVIGVNANRAFGRHYIDVVLLADVGSEIDLTVRTPEWAEWKWFALDALPDTLFDAARAAVACFRDKKVCAEE
jgi:8-oxo-dGTP diphosphatase